MARRGDRGTGEWGTQRDDAGRRGRRSRVEPETTGSWSLGDYEWPTGEQNRAPWDEEPDWEAPPSAPGRPLGDLSAGHPSGPLPQVRGSGHPSGPLPPVRGGRRPADGFPASGPYLGQRGAAPGRGRRGRDYDTGAYPPFEDTGSYDGGEFAPGGYDTGAFPASGYDTGSFAPGGYDTGSWQAPEYPQGRPPGARRRDGYDDEPAGGPPRGGPPSRPAADGSRFAGDRFAEELAESTGAHARYPEYAADDEYDADQDDWYDEEADDQADWADDDDDDFLPGLGGVNGPRSRDEGRRPSGGKSRPARKRGRRAVKVFLLTFLLLILGGGGGAFYYVWTKFLHPADYTGSGSGSVVVQIHTGDTASTIGQILQQDGVVASERAFHNAAVSSSNGAALEPGYYRLHKHMQASLALAMLLSGKARVVYKITIPEGLRLSQIIATLGKDTHNPAGYQAAVKQVSQLGLPSYAKGNPEGFLFPSTYSVWPSTPPIQVLQEMVREFVQQTQSKSLNMLKRAAYDGMSLRQIITVASIVQAEGGRLSDFPKIARVIYNRLNVGMPLQCDSTVMYALNTYGIAATQKQLNAAQKSPYDTYTHYGLPPGPIDSPGYAAIQAALYPAQGHWTYFVTVDPAKHITKFTANPNQAQIWVQELQAAMAKGKG